MSDRRVLPVPEGLIGERADAAVSRLLGISRTAAAQLASDGHIQISGLPVSKSYRLLAADWLEIEIPDPPRVAPEPSAIGMTVVFDDDDVVVIDKPVGVAAHPSVGWQGPTVTGALSAAGYRISTSGASERQGIVQRLDVGTSGLMVVAKSERAYSVLKQAFRDRAVSKTYHAMVQGHLDPLVGTIDAPIGRHPVADHRYAVTSGGRASITHYEVLEMFTGAALVQVHLETGRTHQIRVHFSAMRHPLVGDQVYGGDPVVAAKLGLTRQWLHACRLGFTHPASGDSVEFTSDYPEDLQHALTLMRG